MKILITLICLANFSALAAVDPKAYIGTFDQQVYSLKTKGVKDFVVDISSSRLSKQVDDQMTFGKVKDLTFRVYWTASPERIAIEVLGLPEGFREVKEELKANILAGMENLLPIPVQDKFKGYKITAGATPKEFIAQDQSGVAVIPSYVLKFDAKDILTDVTGKRPIGSFNVATTYEKESFADGKLVLTKQVTTSEENGQSSVSTKELDYGEVNGIGVLEEVEISMVQKWDNPEAKPLKTEETLQFKNYKINSGDALKYFLSNN